MRIVVEQRYVIKPDGNQWLQCKYLDKTYMNAAGAIDVTQCEISEWEDVPIRHEDWPDKD